MRVAIAGAGNVGQFIAADLLAAGHQVTMIEKGPHINPYTDFKQTQDPRYLLRYLKGVSGPNLGLTYAEALGGGSGSRRTSFSVLPAKTP